ncbi:hypothetical protein HPB50_018642 [Hyalomma asiaticum]|uniref:Uncharacterized protein n=1 Tax=Hyalomma asiaticum TaxID=266040 RepID=A0ACB7T266_HYAAI|nr:hypothetical protein HPB50_018642 [Hyalomma asiaticum]
MMIQVRPVFACDQYHGCCWMSFKIVFPPIAGVNLAKFNDAELRAAVVANSGLQPSVAAEDIMCTNLPKNIFTVSTSCAERVSNYVRTNEN